ncbi:MAG: glycoside hydrolase family 3 C-terminal domain-containing protein [Melioribacteraceae bacterium]|nr:glycoside hydrolase family 3 C-terminal domain-containing protein [Melioribacteraceae bacterium]
MRIKIVGIILIVLGIAAFMAGIKTANKPIYLNTAYSFQERAADLVSRMTLEEKQSQLGNTMPPIPRLGVHAYDVWGEALHGIQGRNNNAGMTATSFPNSVAAGATWDPELIKRETSVIADEARGFNYEQIFTLTYWSPVIEPARDPRWGRTAETFGEDPFLVSRIASGFIKGLMGDDPTYLKAVPCGKHFLANNTEFNRHSGSSNMDARDMREYYLTPYRTLIKKDNLPAIMTAYNAVNGVPVSASKFLVDTVARKTYGLDGYVTGDCGAISDMIRGHNYAKGEAEATALGLKTGVDTDCGGVYQTSTIKALKEGLISEGDIDKALVNIFAVRMRLGEFDPDNIVPYAGIKPNIINDPSHNDLALEVATKAPVLLKNENVKKINQKALPLDFNNIKKIAVLGPQADKVVLGDYSGEVEPHLQISPLKGIQNYIKENDLNIEVVSSAGGNTDRKNDFYTLSSLLIIDNNGSQKEYNATKFDEASKGLITTPRFGQASVRGIKDGDWISFNNIDITNLDSVKFNMNVFSSGGAIELRVGSVTGNIIAEQKVISELTGFRAFRTIIPFVAKVNTLGLTGPQNIYLVFREPEAEATDKETLDMAASSDVAIIFVGTDLSTGREESDRFSLVLPGNQMELIEAVSSVNPNTIVVMQTMGMVEVEQIKNNINIPGIIWTGYNGQAQGTAIAKILFGEVNPGGKLNVTWHKSVNDLPDFDDYTLRGNNGNNGRTYWYFDKDVSYEFGYGQSYTTFEYSNFSINKSNITPNDKVTINFNVENTGDYDGDEIVQIYVKTPDTFASLERPIKRLKGFKRITIPAGHTKTVSINIDCSDLWFWDSENDRITFDQGKYVFEIGASSKDIRGKVEAVMSGLYKPELKTVIAECGEVVFRPGDVTQTSVTASLSDDSFLDINKVKVTYKSNNTAVASVNESGKVTINGVGIATIYAYVTYDGKTVSGSYPVKVMPDLNPDKITVNGKIIEGFTPDIKAYSYLLSNNSQAPKVGAFAVSDNITVYIQHAKNIPGTSVISFIDNITLEKNIYYINFDINSVSDEFNDASVGNQWEWLRENQDAHSFSKKPGSLTIRSEVGDVSESTNNAKNILLQSANNDWTIQTKLVCSRAPSQPENAGILAYENDDNFVKLMFRAVIKTTRPGWSNAPQVNAGTVDLIIEENGIAKSLAAFKLKDEIVGDNWLLLKLEKRGSLYTAYYSFDGEKYEKLGTADMMLKDIKAGLIVCDGIITQNMKSTFWFDSDTTKLDTPFDVSFDYFHIKNSGRN